MWFEWQMEGAGETARQAYRTWISAVGLGGRPKRWLR
jgi:hypothetical protein